MKDKVKSLGLGLSAAGISLSTSLLPAARTACTGICGSCGGGCAGLVLGLAGSFIYFARLKKQANKNQSMKEEGKTE